MFYTHTVRFPEQGHAALRGLEISESHFPLEVRAGVAQDVRLRWVEVDCVCGHRARSARPSPLYANMLQEAWDACCLPPSLD